MAQSKFIYLDNNATTRTDERVVRAMLPYFTDLYANAGSSHLFGLTINEAVETATEEVATLIGTQPKRIIFTGGATEAINLAVKGLSCNKRKHIVTVATEHKAMLETCLFMQGQGYTVTALPVLPDGLLDLDMLKALVTEDTLLVSVMFANNETGVIQNIAQIAAIAHAVGALFLTDATQAVGKLPVDVNAFGIDMLTLSAHKFYGPKGIGALYISAHTKLHAQLHGGGQQRGLRSGTLNVPGIVGLGEACRIAAAGMEGDALRVGKLRDHLEKQLLEITDTFVNGNQVNRLYNTSNICFKGVEAEKLIIALKNIAVSNGSACSAVTTQPSHVLKAMGLSDADALSSIRFSLGRFTTDSEIKTTINQVKMAVKKLRGI